MNRRQLAAGIALMALFLAVLYSRAVAASTISPEFPWYYHLNAGRSLGDILSEFWHFNFLWYRPLAAHLPYWIGQHFLDWHNHSGWKVFHLITVLLCGFGVSGFALLLFPGRPLAAWLAGAWFLAHPNTFLPAIEVTSFDFLHILLVLATAALYLKGWWKSAWIAFLLALMCKETALATPFLLAWIAIVERRPWRREIQRLAPFFLVLPVYYVLHLAHLESQLGTNPGYRTTLQLEAIANNLRSFPLWMARIYVGTVPTGEHYFSNRITDGFGICVLMAAIWGWTRLVHRERRPLLLLAGWAVIFLALPVISGGWGWHINLALPAAAILIATGVSEILVVRRAVAVALLSALLLMIARRDIEREIWTGAHSIGFALNRELLAAPPLPAAAIPANAQILIEDRLQLGEWAYGCNSYLLPWLYQRRDIHQMVLPPLSSLPVEAWKRPGTILMRYDGRFHWTAGPPPSSPDFEEHGLHIVPAFASLVPGQRVQFVVPGSPAAWSVEPASAGTITPDGWFTAGASLGEAQILARASGAWARVRVHLGSFQPIRVVAGDPAADASYLGGTPFQTTRPKAPFPTERYGPGGQPFEYRFAVPPGTYRVRLEWAETWYTTRGHRRFHVVLNGARVVEDLDIAARAGGALLPFGLEYPVKAPGGLISVGFEPSLSSPKINRIEILR